MEMRLTCEVKEYFETKAQSGLNEHLPKIYGNSSCCTPHSIKIVSFLVRILRYSWQFMSQLSRGRKEPNIVCVNISHFEVVPVSLIRFSKSVCRCYPYHWICVCKGFRIAFSRKEKSIWINNFCLKISLAAQYLAAFPFVCVNGSITLYTNLCTSRVFRV